MTGNELLSFEQFIQDKSSNLPIPTFGNFFQLFLPCEWGEMLRKKPVFSRFQTAHPELCQEIMDCIRRASEDEQWEKDVKLALTAHHQLLYRVYCAMHPLVLDTDLEGWPVGAGRNDLLFG